ncbi:hypothetical protein F5Y19DRAFT_411612 [Xylariaceae sp. FL1651]|nr:hypothetical protein F5Y19DRAFT_411612 [Xylariaceae sp. FL1651]
MKEAPVSKTMSSADTLSPGTLDGFIVALVVAILVCSATEILILEYETAKVSLFCSLAYYIMWHVVLQIYQTKLARYFSRHSDVMSSITPAKVCSPGKTLLFALLLLGLSYLAFSLYVCIKSDRSVEQSSRGEGVVG